ncbi:MAG: DUF3108 domain-containing protein [Muribaculaceae bacterium]|nr:DUF3108 domain-containing protein [Muribaculaceae bacterium]
MKRLITHILLLILTCSAFASTEKLNYVVTYKWGIIQKDAGDVEIYTTPHGNGYELKLIAKTKPWADHIYKVRDTLVSITEKQRYRPLNYTYIAHEKNRFRKDLINFSYSGNNVTAHAEKVREDKKGNIKNSSAVLEASGPTYDMLSVYFFIRDLDYANMKPGENTNATIISGTKKENLEVKFLGKERVKLSDKSEHDAWHITFKFTQQEGKKSSDDINCWISDDDRHIPLLIIGNLPIGQVRVNYLANP